MEKKTSAFSEDLNKFLLAIVFVIIGIAGIVTIAYVMIDSAPKEGEARLQAATSVFNATLPMIGTWVGAVLAYYFGSKQVQALQQNHEVAMDAIQEQSAENLRSAHELVKSQADQIIAMSK